MSDERYIRKGDVRGRIKHLINKQTSFQNPYNKEDKAEVMTHLDAIIEIAITQAERGDRHARIFLIEYLEGKAAVSALGADTNENPYKELTPSQLRDNIKLLEQKKNDNGTGHSISDARTEDIAKAIDFRTS